MGWTARGIGLIQAKNLMGQSPTPTSLNQDDFSFNITTKGPILILSPRQLRSLPSQNPAAVANERRILLMAPPITRHHKSKRRARNKKWEFAGCAESMDEEVTSSQNSKHWWDVALVLADRYYDGATVSLLSTEEDRIDKEVAFLDHDYTVGMGFALVGSKLYGFGNFWPVKVGPLDFFVCDLKDDGKPSKFRKAGKLKGPKNVPIALPFPERKQILIIATGMGMCGWCEVKGPYCEVLELPCERNGGQYKRRSIETPWDHAFGPAYHFTPVVAGHFVLGDRVYIKLHVDIGSRVFTFSMTTFKWTEGWYADQVQGSGGSTGLPSPRLFLEPFYEFLDMIIRDKFFDVTVRSLDTGLEFFVGAMNVMDVNGITDLEKEKIRTGKFRGIVPSLESLEKFLTDNYSHYPCGHGWVMPFGHDHNLFYLFIAFHNREMSRDLLVCKFQLSDDDSMDTGDDDTAPRPRRYKSDILTSKLYKCSLPCEQTPLYVLTPSARYRFFT